MTLPQSLTTDLASRIGWALTHSLWEGTIVAAHLWIVLILVLRRRSPQSRYLASMSAIALMLAGVVVTFLNVAPSAPRLPRFGEDAAVAGPWIERPSPFRNRHGFALPSTSPPTFGPRPGESPKSELTGMSQMTAPSITARLAPAMPSIVGVWVAGVLVLSLWNIGGWIAVQRLKALGTGPVSADAEAIADRLARRLKLSKPVRVLQSVLAETPFVIGWLRPVVLLPASVLTGLTGTQLEAVLAHELAHIRRHDYLINLFQVAVETLLFYHPAIWWMSRRTRLEREQCCDDVAVSVCGDRCAYVESLTALEEVRLAGRLALSASGAGRSQLVVRVKRLLGFCDDSPRPTISAAFVTILLLSALVTLTALLGNAPQTRADAQAKPVPATEPATQAAGHPATSPASAAPVRRKLLLVTEGNYWLEQSVARREAEIDVAKVTPAQYEAGEADRYDVVVFDCCQPRRMPLSGAVLYFDAVPPNSTLAETDGQGQPAIITDVRVVARSPIDPILKGLKLNDLFVAKAIKLREAPGWTTLADSQQGALIVSHQADSLREIVVSFDVRESNWPLRASFPGFIDGALDWLMNAGKETPSPASQPSTGQASHATGSNVYIDALGTVAVLNAARPARSRHSTMTSQACWR